MRALRTALIPGIAILASVAMTGCTAGTDSSSDTASGSGDTIVAAADPSLLPYNFLGDDNVTWEGINVDLAAALSEQLGQTIEFESTSFDNIIPGLTSGRYDMALTGMFDTQEREQSVDFVDYLGAKNDFLTPTGTTDIESMSDPALCGLTVGIPSGALESSLLADASTACTNAGNAAITVNEYSDLNAVITALTSGRIEVAPNDSATNAYVLDQYSDTLKVSGSYENEGYFAAAFPKDSELTQRVEDAFNAIIADGTYAQILEKWGISDRSLDEAITNGAPF